MGSTVVIDLDPKSIRRGELARRTGYTIGHISRVLSGDRTPSLLCASRIAAALGLSLDDFNEWFRRVIRPED